jgi:S1-C subfamily serine protease
MKDEEPFDLRKAALKFGVPLALVVIVLWAWKRHNAPAPVTHPVTTTVATSQTSQEIIEPTSVPERSRTSAASAASAGPRNAEQVFGEVSAAVVRVRALDDRGQPIKQGSGVTIGSGRVITNCHVTSGASRVVVLSGRETYSASVRVADEQLDLCSLDVSGFDAPAVTVGSIDTVRTGQRVFAIGAPLGLDLTISEGIVSSLREMPQGKVIQTSAPVSPGSSGGGLFDTQARLIGVVTFQTRSGQNLNFALPADWISQMSNRSGPARESEEATGEDSGSSSEGLERMVPQRQ